MKNVINFGCRLNAYESNIISQDVKEHGLDDIVIINTCSVTQEAEKKAKQAIRRVGRKYPKSTIVVTGCSAQINPQQFSEMDQVQFVIGNGLKMSNGIYKTLKSRGFPRTNHEKIITTDIMIDDYKRSSKISGFEDRTRAFVQVQNGCNHRCTFCIIPYGRGNSRSVPLDEILSEISCLVDMGYKEVILTGVDLTDYGSNVSEDTNSLGKLCKKILNQVPHLQRLRLSSIDVAEIDRDIVDLIANEPRFMPHLHISLQSGDDLILKRMKRRHNRAMVIKFCSEMRKLRPNITFGSDIIAGFPTETDQMFQNTKDLLMEANIVFNHIFTYSERPNTPAARMPQVSQTIKKQRTKELISETESLTSQLFESMIGTVQSVIIEIDGMGRAENFAPVKINYSSDVDIKKMHGTVLNLNIMDSNNLYVISNFD